MILSNDDGRQVIGGETRVEHAGFLVYQLAQVIFQFPLVFRFAFVIPEVVKTACTWQGKTLYFTLMIQQNISDADCVIKQAARLMRKIAPDATVILFGSYAQNNQRPDSDLDLLVVKPVVVNRRAEMVRLRRALKPLGIPVDVLVISKRVFDEWRDTPNTILCDAATKGRVLNEVA